MRTVLLSMALLIGSCGPSKPPDPCPFNTTENCPPLPACPAGATCSGPCDPDAGVTHCALGFGATCASFSGADGGWIWECEGG
jgi:hypothetical protein